MERSLRRGFDRHVHGAEEVRQVMGAQREPGHDAEGAAIAALQRPEQVRMGAGVGDPHGAIGGDDLGFQQARRGQAVSLREAAEAAALDQARHADGQAAAALDVAAGLGRHRIVDVPPDRTRLDRDRRLRRESTGAPGADKRVVQGDPVHPPGPDQQRIDGIGSALIAVTAALDDQPQIVFAREIDRRDDIVRALGGDRVHARPRRPGAHPAQGLRQPDFVAQVVWVPEIPEDLGAGGARRRIRAGGERRLHLDQPSPDRPAQPFPARFGWPCGVAGTDARPGSDCRTTRWRSEHSRPRSRQKRHGRGRLFQKTSSVHSAPSPPT